MDGKPALKSIRIRNVLSFGDQWQSLDFEPLNVLIGPNGSGKSNLLEILGLLRALPDDLAEPFKYGRGITEWVWKGRSDTGFFDIETTWNWESSSALLRGYGITLAAGAVPLRHRIVLAAESFRPRVVEEQIDQGEPGTPDYVRHYFFNSRQLESSGGPEYFDHLERTNVTKSLIGFRTNASILAQRWEPDRCPGLALLVDQYARIRMYRRWTFGPKAPVREPQGAALPGDFLLEDATNLALILNNLLLDRGARDQILENLPNLYEGARDIRIKVVSGYLELHVVEEAEERLIPAARLSDGTLRYLSLLALLCHPDPPPLLCIEEPELGLHPDLIRGMTRLMRGAAERSQLVITTHSTELVAALSDSPETVVICERDEAGTHLKRLDQGRLEKWLEDFTLGELWRSGEIGGNRW